MILRPRTARRIRLATAGLFALSAALFAAGGVARADGHLTPGEEQLGDAISTSLCTFIDTSGVSLSAAR